MDNNNYNLHLWCYIQLLTNDLTCEQFLTNKGKIIMNLVKRSGFKTISEIARVLKVERCTAHKLAVQLNHDNILTLNKIGRRSEVNFNDDLISKTKEYIEKLEIE